MPNQNQLTFVLVLALFHPLVSFHNKGNTCRSCLRLSSFTERESSDDMDVEKTPLMQFMDAFATSLSESVHSFQKISLTEPVDDGLAPKWTAIDGRFLKEKNMLQLSKKKGKTVLSSSNHDINEGISIIQQCLQV